MSAPPDNAALKARLGQLTSAQRAALSEKLGRGEAHRQSAPVPLVTCPARAQAGSGPLVVPASHAQRRMWFLHSYAPDSPAYNTAKLFRLHGPLDGAVLERALQALTARHETLRTTFELRGTEVMQVVARHAEFRLETTDLSGLAEAEREAQMARLAEEWSRRAFDLERGPLWRAWLVRLGAEEHALAAVVHHIVFDGWSLGVFCRELGSLYGSLVAGWQLELPELRVQYADFAHWQERFLSGQVLSRLSGYWQRKLQDAPPALDLPADRPRPSVESLRGANRNFTLSRALRAELATLAQREEVTLFMVLLAAFKVLLCRHAQQEDVTVGVPFANRNPRETEALIGCFLNTLPLRTGLAGDPTFAELLQRVKQTVLEAHDHAELPFESLVQLLPTGRDLSRSPWFQYFFQLRNVPRERIEAGPVRSEMAALLTGTAKFTISLHVDEQDGELACDWEYDTALFDAETIDRMAARWETLLRGIVAQSQSRIAALPLLADDEHRLLAEWNRMESEFPRERCVHHLFEEQAARTPEAVAVVFGAQRLTYRELNAQAEELARHLCKIDVRPEMPVGVCMERSIEMVVALLGVLKAGGAYVPLDPLFPLERLAYIIANSGSRVVLTQATLRERLPATGLELVFLDATLPATSTGPVALHPVKSDQLAYVIYTSGSTGRPKGVEIQHGAVVNFLCDMRGRLGLTASDALLAVTSICFDISVLELFLPLTIGARVVVCADAGKSDGIALAAELKSHAISCLQATPASWRMLLNSGWRGDAQLKALCGGEALAEDLAAALLPRCRELWNLYGPTETTIWSTAALIRPGKPVHIGRPLANTQLHILDPRGQPAPIGVPGELFIGGVGLARGYRNRPELTAERFIPCPAGLGDGRLYRTGDTCRWRADGQVEFLGRLDRQIKLRGYRIEPGEIEAVLRQCPGVREAVVVAREDHLVAYVVTESAATTEVRLLREALAQRLPGYMVPAAFVFLPALPLTPNGKLDLNALPRPEAQPAVAANALLEPKTLLEQRLVELWQRCLGTNDVSPEDDFFELGGHSLLAARLRMDIGQLTGQPVPIAMLFHAPTPRKLALWLAENRSLPPWTSLVPLKPTGCAPPVFFVHGLGGLVSGFLGLARRLPPDQPAYGLQAVGLDGQIAGPDTIEGMAAHYVREMISLQPEGPYYLVGYSAGGLIAYEMARQLQFDGRQVAMLALFDTHPIFCRMPWHLFARAMVTHFTERWHRQWRSGTWLSTKLCLIKYLAGRCRDHWRIWLTLSGRDRLAYLEGRHAALQYWLLSRNLPKATVAMEESESAGSEPLAVDPLQVAMPKYWLRHHKGAVDFFVSEDSNASSLTVWSSLALGGLQTHRIRGEHSRLLDACHLEALARTFESVLATRKNRNTGRQPM